MLEELDVFIERIKDYSLDELKELKIECLDIINKYNSDDILHLVKIYPNIDELYQVNLKYLEAINQLIVYNLMLDYNKNNFTKYFNEWDMFSLEDKIKILEEAINKKIDVLNTDNLRIIMEEG